MGRLQHPNIYIYAILLDWEIREFCYRYNVYDLPLFKFEERGWLAKRIDYVSHTFKELIEIRDSF